MNTVSHTFRKIGASSIVWTTVLAVVFLFVGMTVLVPLARATAPTVTAAGGPQNLQTGVPVDAFIDKVMSEAVSAGTVTTSTVLLQANTGNTQAGAPDGSNLCTSVTLTNTTNIQCVHAALTASTWYTLTLTTGIQDLESNALAANNTTSFQTSSFVGGAEFNAPPHVEGTIPANGGTLATNGTISVKFSRPMVNTLDAANSVRNVATVRLFATTNSVVSGSNLLTNTTGWTYNTAQNALVIPSQSLTVGNTYRLIIGGDGGNPTTCTTCVKSSDNLTLGQNNVIVDLTIGASDSTAPTLVASIPADDASAVDRIQSDMALSFSKPLDPGSVSATTINLYCNDTDSDPGNGCDGTNTDAVDGTDVDLSAFAIVELDGDGRTAHITAPFILLSSANYYLRIVSGASGATDTVGNQFAADAFVHFATSALLNGASSDTTAPEVLFANADNSTISITFSEMMDVDLSANATETTSSGSDDVNNLANWTLETSSDAGTTYNQVPLTGKTVHYIGFTNSLEISGLTLPPDDQFRVTAGTAIEDISDNGMNASVRSAIGTVLSSSTTGGALGPGAAAGPVDFFTQGVDPIEVFPQTGLAGATSRYRVEFRATKAIPASGKITLTYPTGFSFGANCATLPSDSFINADLNGPGTGTVSVASIACNSISRTVTLVLGATGTVANDRVSFEIQGVTNSTVAKDFSTDGYVVGIKTINSAGLLLESKTSLPFFIGQGGSLSVSGRLFVDDGAGGGTANNGTQDGTEAGAVAVDVCLGGPFGFNCTATDSSGDYTFGSLTAGFYHLDIPPIASGTLTGGPFFRDIEVQAANVTGVNFPLASAVAQDILDVYVDGGAGLAGTKVDVFAFSSSSGTVGPQSGPGAPGGFVVRELTLDGSGTGSVDLPLTTGLWVVGVGPATEKKPGTAMTVPDFNFMPPPSTQVNVSGSGVPDLCTSGTDHANQELCFTITATTSQILGKVIDGAGAGIANVFVMARPSFLGDASTTDAGFAMVAKTDVTGNFTLKTLVGSYVIEAFMPGMSGANPVECIVKTNTAAVDSNATADVHCNGKLIVNDVANFSASSLTPGNVTKDDLVLRIAKGDTSISGRVLDDAGNAIAFAHVTGQQVDGSGNPLGKFVDRPTDSSGNYTLYVNGGASGSETNWKVRAFAPGFGELPAITVSVTTGTNLTGKNLQPVTGNFKTVSGTVYIDSDGDSTIDAGEGVSGAHVNIFGASGGNGGVTGSDGSYTIKVASGTGYTVEGFIPGQGPTGKLTAQDFTDNATGKNLKMVAPGTLQVLLCTPTDANDLSQGCASNQISNAFVDAFDAAGVRNGTSANTTAGIYEIILPGGTYTVKARNGKVGLVGSATAVVVTANATTRINLTPPAAYTVSGTISSTDTSCIEGTTMTLMDPTNGRMILSPANASGAWSISGVPNGSYSVVASKPGCIDNAQTGTITVSGVNVTESVDTDLARTMVASNASITGHVFIDADSDSTFDSGENVSYETIIFATTSTGKVVVTSVDIGKTGSDNNYTLDLTVGDWTITARTDGSASAATSVTVASGDALTQDLKLVAIAGFTRTDPKTSSMKPSRGGIVKNNDIGSDFAVNIPAGALGTSSNDGSVVTKKTSAVANTNTQTVLGGTGFEITPKNSSGQPIITLGSASTVTLPYVEADVTTAGATEENVLIGTWSEEKQQWEPQPTTCDTAANTCTATVTHFSTFGTIVTASTVTNTTTSSSSGSSGSAGGGAPAATTSVTVTAPNGGESLESGSVVPITWTSAGTGISEIRIKLSSDGGLSFSSTVATVANSGSYEWTVPEASGSNFRLSLEALNTYAVVVYSDQSNTSFSIGPAGAIPEPDTPASDEESGVMLAPGVDIPGVTSGASFNTELARTTSSSINVDLGLSASAEGVIAACTSNGLVKGEGSAAVYYCGANGSRYVFMNEQVYFTWYANFDTVLTVSDSTLASIPLSGVVTHRPGVKMVKIESDPKVYAIGRGGLLRWVSSEAIALALYGADWNQMVQDMPVSLFARFTMGPDITE